MYIKTIFTLALCALSFYANAIPVNLIEAIKLHKVEAVITGNLSTNNPQGSSHTGKCLLLNIKNNSSNKIDIKIESAYYFENLSKSNQDLMSTENMIVSIAGNESKSVAINALCSEKSNASPSVKDTFKLIKKQDITYANLTNIFEKYKCYLNTAQQALWCFTDNNAIDNIYDTHTDTLVENTLVAYVSNVKGVPVPARRRFVDVPRILRYPVEVDSSISIYIERTTTIGIYITDTNQHHVVATLFDDDTETRTGTAKYSYFYRGQLPKGTYFVEMKKNGEWVILKKIIISGQ
jgi:hypothetical protein